MAVLAPLRPGPPAVAPGLPGRARAPRLWGVVGGVASQSHMHKKTQLGRQPHSDGVQRSLVGGLAVRLGVLG